MITRISRELAHFLKSKGLYTNFMKYNRCSELRMVSLLTFDWNKTAEGYMFWEKISSEYSTYLASKTYAYLVKQFKNIPHGFN